jgi:hypothetical protein
MLTIAQAKNLAQAHLSTSSEESGCEVVIVDSATVERSFGWVFFYESRQYLETGEFMHRLVGNAPLIVNRITGDIVSTGTAHPTEYYLAEYEASLPRGGA